MKKLLILYIFFNLIGCSPDIKSITKYTKKNDEFVKTLYTEFDRNSNKILNKNLGNKRSNRITKTLFKGNQKISETSCDYFVKQDTCVIRSFTEFEFDNIKKIQKLTLFEPDSSIRHIKETKRMGNIAIEKVFSWEMFPSKNPKTENAIILTDTIYYDSKGREIKRKNYNAKIKEPFIETYTYDKNGYTYQISGTNNDRTIYFKLNKLQKKALKNNLDYRFYHSDKYRYVFEYYNKKD